MASVKLTDVKKVYDNKVTAVHDFNLDIKDKEFIVFVGPSGCGKSTTLRMVAGLEDITRGKLLLDGRDITAAPAKDRDMAMVFQNYALYGHMTVYENMAFSLTLRRAYSHLRHSHPHTACKQASGTYHRGRGFTERCGGNDCGKRRSGSADANSFQRR